MMNIKIEILGMTVDLDFNTMMLTTNDGNKIESEPFKAEQTTRIIQRFVDVVEQNKRK